MEQGSKGNKPRKAPQVDSAEHSSGSDSESPSVCDEEPPQKRARQSNFGESAPAPPSEPHISSTSDIHIPEGTPDDLLNQMLAFAASGTTGPCTSPGVTITDAVASAMAELRPPPPGVDASKWKTVMCMYWEKGSCGRGQDCAFAHGQDELAAGIRKQAETTRAGVPATTRMEFGGLDAGRVSRTFSIPDKLMGILVTDRIKNVLLETTGAFDAQFERAKKKVTILGTPAQAEKVGNLLQRVSTHCHWGVNEAKIHRLLRPLVGCTSARCTLSPMVPTLRQFTMNLSIGNSKLKIGTGDGNHLKVRGSLLSRAHAVLEFVPTRGVVYVIDTSTNGTFLNGKRLPEKASAKVVLWHGDELLLQDPAAPGQSGEFGYMVNLEIA